MSFGYSSSQINKAMVNMFLDRGFTLSASGCTPVEYMKFTSDTDKTLSAVVSICNESVSFHIECKIENELGVCVRTLASRESADFSDDVFYEVLDEISELKDEYYSTIKRHVSEELS